MSRVGKICVQRQPYKVFRRQRRLAETGEWRLYEVSRELRFVSNRSLSNRLEDRGGVIAVYTATVHALARGFGAFALLDLQRAPPQVPLAPRVRRAWSSLLVMSSSFDDCVYVAWRLTHTDERVHRCRSAKSLTSCSRVAPILLLKTYTLLSLT